MACTCACAVIMTGPPALAQEVFSDRKGCHANKPGQTAIKINLTLEEEPIYDLSRSIAWLNRDGGKSTAEWLARNGLTAIYKPSQFVTKGQAHGGLAMTSRASLFSKSYGPYGGYQCPYFRQIEVNIFYRTLIYIPSDYQIGTCAFNEIQMHELKHHTTNVDVVKAAVEKMRKDLPAIIREMEGNAYLPHDKIRPHFETMKTGIDDFIQVYFTELASEEMDRRNHLVDTPAEYERSGKALRDCRIQDKVAQLKK